MIQILPGDCHGPEGPRNDMVVEDFSDYISIVIF